MPITVLDLALHRGAVESPDGTINGGEFQRVGLPIFGGCMCGTTVAAYNAYPTTAGVLGCHDCVGSRGFDTVEEADAHIFGDD